MHHETPGSWMKLWEGPEDPVQWLKAIMQKTNALSVWLEKVKGGSLLSSVLDLSELFHPDTFLNAFRQQTARYRWFSVLFGWVASGKLPYFLSTICPLL